MNCKAVPLQSPVSHSAHWVEMDNNNEPPTGFHNASDKIRSERTKVERWRRLPASASPLPHFPLRWVNFKPPIVGHF